MNSSILAQYLALNATVYGFNRLQNALMKSMPTLGAQGLLDSFGPIGGTLMGVKIQLSGLLTTQRNAPRKTVSTASTGTFHGSNVTVEYSCSTLKSALGAYTVKV